MRLKYRLIATSADLLLRAILATCRIEYYGRETEQLELRAGRTLIYGIWHRTAIFSAWNLRGRSMGAIVSQSEDGEIIDGLLKRYQFKTCRGSSRRGGRDAFYQMIDHIQAGGCGCITADGPTGPPYEAKHGIITLASRTGASILPYAVDCEPGWVFNSWDRTFLPKPFARIIVAYDSQLLEVPSDKSREEYEVLRQAFDERLNRLSYQVRYACQHRIKGDPRDIEVPADYLDYLPRKVKKNS